MSPIRASQRARYPADWDTAVRPRILARADGRCECRGECGHDHRAEAAAVSALLGHRVPMREPARCLARDRRDHPVTGSRVVLTVAHRDHTPEHCDDENLRAMCQRCHLAYDADHHATTRANSRAAQLARQMDPLFPTQHLLSKETIADGSQ